MGIESVIEDVWKQAFDTSYDVGKEAVENSGEGRGDVKAALDCINESGYHAGDAAGHVFVGTGLGDDPLAHAEPTQTFAEAQQVCFADFQAPTSDLQLPEVAIDAPSLTGLAVAFTPSELNLGETQMLAHDVDAPIAYQDGFDRGFHDGEVKEFDNHLDHRFDIPDSSQSSDTSNNVMDTGPSYDAHSDAGSYDSSHDSSSNFSDSGGSSGGSSGSSDSGPSF